MKNKYLIIGLAVGTILSSCSDFLDREPSTELPAEGSITTLFNLQNTVNGVGYAIVQGRMTYGGEYTLYADMLSGDFKVIKDYGQSSAIAMYTITQHDALPDYGYYYFYNALANANQALENVPNIICTEDEKATLNDLHGQLLAWRGLLHFDLARMFCHIPSTVSNLDEPNSGLVISDQVFEPSYKGTRSTLKQTYDQIITDFTDAMKLIGKDKNLGYLNYWACLTLRARAYLYLGKYDLALADAKEVIASSPYSLYTMAEYADVWDKQGTSEAILELLVTDNYNAQRNSPGYYTSSTGYPECGFNPDSELFQYLINTEDDVRSRLISDETSTKVGGYYPAKYPGRSGSIYVNNPKIIRLSEVYLIAAESAYYLSDETAAAEYVNELRRNRIANYADVASVTLDDILFEYEKELFAENQIAFAYWRNKRSIQPSMITSAINYDNDRTILPIPQGEIDLNPDLKQNPGY